jgi:hypothetical protein
MKCYNLRLTYRVKDTWPGLFTILAEVVGMDLDEK